MLYLVFVAAIDTTFIRRRRRRRRKKKNDKNTMPFLDLSKKGSLDLKGRKNDLSKEAEAAARLG